MSIEELEAQKTPEGIELYIRYLTGRIEALEAALREIACESGTHDRGRADCCIARRALEGKHE